MWLLAACDDRKSTPETATVTAPVLPTSVEGHTRRPPGPYAELSAEDIRSKLRQGIEQGAVIGEMRAIVATLQQRLVRRKGGKRVYLLFGGHHDAGEQVDVFRRFVGPLGLTPAPLAAIELLSTRDNAALARYLASGDRTELDKLLAHVRQHNYTAWKFGYVDRIADLLVTMHSSGRRLIGCDSQQDELRDLHCASTLEHALAQKPAPTVALMWGEAHLAPDRLPRFLPAVAEVWRIHMLGHRRRADVGLEAALGLALTSPLLVPIEDSRFVLLLDGRHLSATVDRVRTALDFPAAVRVRGAEGTLQLSGRRLRLTREDVVEVDLAPGPKTFMLDRDVGADIAGAFEVPLRGRVELDFSERDVVRISSHDRDVMDRRR